MKNLFKKLKRLIFGPRTEIGFVEASLKLHKRKLFNLEFDLADFDPSKECCEDCATGGYYSKLKQKISRIEKQLENLKKKRKN
jgi:hypothetical protein